MLSFARSDKGSVRKPLGKVEEMVRSIQNGDFALREQFIIEYKPFILKCVSKYSHASSSESSDEFSIALIAFNEAINAFKMVKGMAFLSFSEMVIRNRLNDNARKNRNQRNIIPFVSLEQGHEEESSEPYEIPSEDPSFQRLEVMDEIRAFTLNLKDYGIQFADLVRLSPKHQDTRKRLIGLAKLIFSHEGLLFKLKKTRGIPIRELLEHTSVCRGTIEQHRKYLIALVLILDSHLDTLKSYIDVSSQGGERHAN